MSTKKIRWGIIGAGTIAHQFANDFQYAANAELCVVASRSVEKASAFAELYQIPSAYGSYEELYNDPEIDAVYIATPHNFHFQNSIDAIQNGKAVLCEKPLTVSPHECEKLIDIANSANIYLAEGMWTYFLPAISKAQEWIAAGRIGKITQIKSDFGYPVPFVPQGRMFNPSLAGGALLDMGVYTIAMAWLFTNQDPIKVTVFGRNAVTGVDHDISMLLEYQDASALLTTSFRSKLPNFTYVIGEEGYIEIPDFWRAREAKLYKVEECIDQYNDRRSGNGFEFEIESVSDDLLEGKLESKVVTHQASLHFQQMMQLIRDKLNANSHANKQFPAPENGMT